MPVFHGVHIMLRHFETRHLSHFDSKWLFFPIWDFSRTFWRFSPKITVLPDFKSIWNSLELFTENSHISWLSEFLKLFGTLLNNFPWKRSLCPIYEYFPKIFELFHRKCRFCLIFNLFLLFRNSHRKCVF